MDIIYLHQRRDWPKFRWREDAIVGPLAAVRHRQGKLLGQMGALGFELRNEAVLATLTTDVVKSSQIEGENLDQAQVRSSIARRLGMEIAGLIPADRNVDGVVEMMLDATQRFDAPFNEERLFGWHAALFPTGYSGLHKLRVGQWRDDANGPMQVVSGPYGREKVHFEAPEASRLPIEMAAFLAWIDGDAPLDPVLRAALAHLWFVTIHPFEDGNGRIARAIADLALARSEGQAGRFYSMSAAIQQRRKSYYDALEHTQKGDVDVTDWLLWFLDCLDAAIGQSEEILATVFIKARFWNAYRGAELNSRQRLMLDRLLDDFEGRLNTSKWAKIAKCSQDTALRDIEGLIAMGILIKEAAGGRSTSYVLIRE
jgi:Fic family protein